MGPCQEQMLEMYISANLGFAETLQSWKYV